MHAAIGTDGAIKPVRAAALLSLPWLVHAFSTRSGGTTSIYGRNQDLNLGFTADDSRETVLANRRLFLDSLAIPPGRLVTVRQVHSATTVVAELGAPSVEADGVITNEPGVLLGIQTADCVPVLVADPRTHSVGAFHAGWRGTVHQIVEQGIARMMSTFGSDPADLVAAIGPSIGSCCYKVGPEVLDEFVGRFPYAAELIASGGYLDLRDANRRQLSAAGLVKRNISLVGGCTSCEPERYFSHRAQKGKTGRMLAVIGLR